MWFVFPLYRQLRVGNGRGCEIYNAKIRVMYSRVAFDEFGQPYIAEEELKLVENVRSCIKYVQRRSRDTAASRRSCCCRHIHSHAPTRSISGRCCLHFETPSEVFTAFALVVIIQHHTFVDDRRGGCCDGEVALAMTCACSVGALRKACD